MAFTRAQAYHNLSVLLEAGVPIVACAEMSAGVTGNAVVAGWLSPGADSARAGGVVSDGFSPELPKDFLDTWRIGEESGTLDEAAGRLADVSLAPTRQCN